LIHMMPPSERERILEDARSVSQRLWRIARLAQDAAESLDERIKDEDLDGMADAVEDAVMFLIGVRIGFKASNVGG
jgi:hypothetical protein